MCLVGRTVVILPSPPSFPLLLFYVCVRATRERTTPHLAHFPTPSSILAPGPSDLLGNSRLSNRPCFWTQLLPDSSFSFIWLCLRLALPAAPGVTTTTYTPGLRVAQLTINQDGGSSTRYVTDFLFLVVCESPACKRK